MTSCNQHNQNQNNSENTYNENSIVNENSIKTKTDLISRDELTTEIINEDLEFDIIDDNYGPDSIITEDGPVFMMVEQMPEFEGGMDSLMNYLKREINYPQTALDDSIQGRVYISFAILKNGIISQVEVTRGIRSDLDDVCIEAIKNMPNWKPGQQRGKEVNVRLIIPIIFKLESVDKTNGVSVIPKKNKEIRVETKLFPNPANNYFNIEISKYATDLEYHLINTNGQILKSGRFNSNNIRINTNDFGKGMYLVKIISKELGLNKTEKLIIRK